MAVPSKSKRLDLAKIDSWISVVQWTWDRASTFLLSGAGAALMAFLGKLSGLTPIAWGAVGFVAFVVLFSLFVAGRRTLAAARKDRAAALYAELTLDRATVDPMEPHFRNQRIRLADLHSPFGEGLVGRSFIGCELIGPAVMLLSEHTIYRGNSANNVEYIRVKSSTIQVWPNKITLYGGLIENCKLFNVIILVPDEYSVEFASKFNDPVFWANDEPPTKSISGPLPQLPPNTAEGTQQ